jgi:hypothetical protein
MKIVSESSGGQVKTTIFSWNNKYLIKYETDMMEQTYKVSQMDVWDDETIKTMSMDPIFLASVYERFEGMAKDLYTNLNGLK